MSKQWLRELSDSCQLVKLEQDSDVDLSKFALYLPFTQSACGLYLKFPGLWYHQVGHLNARLIIMQETNQPPPFPVKIPPWLPSTQGTRSKSLDWVRIDLLDRGFLVTSPASPGQVLPCHQCSIQHVFSDTSKLLAPFWHWLHGDRVRSHRLRAHCPTSDALLKSRLSPVLLSGLKGRVPQPPLWVQLTC